VTDPDLAAFVERAMPDLEVWQADLVRRLGQGDRVLVARPRRDYAFERLLTAASVVREALAGEAVLVHCLEPRARDLLLDDVERMLDAIDLEPRIRRRVRDRITLRP
jgi:hypothetical protein